MANWRCIEGSNPGPAVYKTAALPVELMHPISFEGRIWGRSEDLHPAPPLYESGALLDELERPVK